MPLIRHTDGDILRDRLRLRLEDINKIDLCDLDNDFPDLRCDALREIRIVEQDAVRCGYDMRELYAEIVSEAEAIADFQAEI